MFWGLGPAWRRAPRIEPEPRDCTRVAGTGGRVSGPREGQRKRGLQNTSCSSLEECRQRPCRPNGEQRCQHDTLWRNPQVLNPNRNAQHLALRCPLPCPDNTIAASPLNIPACMRAYQAPPLTIDSAGILDGVAKVRQFVSLTLIRWHTNGGMRAPQQPEMGTRACSTSPDCNAQPKLRIDDSHTPLTARFMHETKPFLGRSAGPRRRPRPPCP